MCSEGSASNSELCNEYMNAWMEKKNAQSLERYGVYAATYIAQGGKERHWFINEFRQLGTAGIVVFAFAGKETGDILINAMFKHLYICKRCTAVLEERVGEFSGMAEISGIPAESIKAFQRILFDLYERNWSQRTKELLAADREDDDDLATCFVGYVFSHFMSTTPTFMDFEPHLLRLMQIDTTELGSGWPPGYLTCMVLWPNTPISSHAKQLLQQEAPYDPGDMDIALLTSIISYYKKSFPPASQKTAEQWDRFWHTIAAFFSQLPESSKTTEMAAIGLGSMRMCRQLDLGSTLAAVELAFKGGEIRLCTRQFCRSKLGSERGKPNQYVTKMFRAIKINAPDVYAFVRELLENSQGLNSIKVGAIALSCIEDLTLKQTNELLLANPDPVVSAMAYIPFQDAEKLGKAFELIMCQYDMTSIPRALTTDLATESDIRSFENISVVFSVIRPSAFSKSFAAFRGTEDSPINLSPTGSAVKDIISQISLSSPQRLTELAKLPGFLSAFWLFSAATDPETARLATKGLAAIDSSQLSQETTITEMLVAVSKIMENKALALCMEDFMKSTGDCARLAASSTCKELASTFWEECWEFIRFLWNVDLMRSSGFTNAGIKEALGVTVKFADALIKLWPQYKNQWDSQEVAREMSKKILPSLEQGIKLLCLQRSSGVLTQVHAVFVEGLTLAKEYTLELSVTASQALKNIVTFERPNQLTPDEAECLAALVGVEPSPGIENSLAPRVPAVAPNPPAPAAPTPAVPAAAPNPPAPAAPTPAVPPRTNIMSFFQVVGREQAVSAAVQSRIPPPPPKPKPKEGSKLALIREELEAKRRMAPSSSAKSTQDVVIHPARPSGFNPREKPLTQAPRPPISGAPPARPQGLNIDSSSDSDSDPEDSQGLIQLGKKSRNASERLGYLSMKKNLRPPQADERAQEAARMKARLLVNADALHKSVLLWDFYSGGLFPPELQGHNVKVPNTFATPEEYMKTMRPLLLMEVWQQIQQQKEAPGDVRAMTFALTVGTRTNVDDFIDLNVTMPYDRYQSLRLSDGDLILLFALDASDPSYKSQLRRNVPHCFGKIRENTVNIHYGQNTADFTVRTYKADTFLRALRPGQPIAGQKVVSLLTAEREYRALGGFEHCELRKEIMNATPSPPVPENPAFIQQLTSNMGLNKSQATAAYQSLHSTGFKLIQGPPGTGKTKTILSIIGAYFSNPSNRRILVCAPSNAAVDELLLRMKAGTPNLQGKTMNLRAVRLGRPDSVSPNVVELCLDRQIELTVTKKANTVDNSIRESLNKLLEQRDAKFAEFENATGLEGEQHMQLTQELDNLKREIGEKKKLLTAQREQLDLARRTKEAEYKRVQNELLSKAQVICCTLSGSASGILSSLELPFKTVIIDEAAQSVELSALIPFRYGCNQCIMVGDPHQLPPTVLNKAAAELDYEQSLFTRIFKQHQNKVSMLDEQFRMHPDIAVFPSNQFYKGLLKTGSEMQSKTARPWHESTMFPPYYFYSVTDTSHKFNARSIKNPKEADAAVNLIATLFKKYPQVKFDDKIGIVTPYKQQMLFIRSLLEQRFGPSIVDSVTVSTIDAFQGQEKDIIIFSTVRASPDSSSIGFVGDIRRMNVAITRARASLWIIGSAKTLLANSEWAKLVDDARSRKMYCEARSTEFGPGLEAIQRSYHENPRNYQQSTDSRNTGRYDRYHDRYRDRNQTHTDKRDYRVESYRDRGYNNARNQHDQRGGNPSKKQKVRNLASVPMLPPSTTPPATVPAPAPASGSSSAPGPAPAQVSDQAPVSTTPGLPAQGETRPMPPTAAGKPQGASGHYKKHASSGLFNVKRPRR